jgi:hypothetical protein
MSNVSIMANAPAVQVSIIPNTPSELVQPFQVGIGGSLEVTSDPTVQAVASILSVAFTLPTERVMNPNIGVGIQSMLFSNSPLSQFEIVASQMQTQYGNLEATSFVASVSVAQNPTDSSSFVFSVEFTLDQGVTVHTAIFNYAGDLVGTS